MAKNKMAAISTWIREPLGNGIRAIKTMTTASRAKSGRRSRMEP